MKTAKSSDHEVPSVGHTPGPWHILGSSDAGQVSIEFAYTDKDCNRHSGSVAIVDGQRGERLRANARLIAAAPDLLEALERLAGVVRDMVNIYGNHSAEWLMSQEIFSYAEAVIRKAKRAQ